MYSRALFHNVGARLFWIMNNAYGLFTLSSWILQGSTQRLIIACIYQLSAQSLYTVRILMKLLPPLFILHNICQIITFVYLSFYLNFLSFISSFLTQYLSNIQHCVYLLQFPFFCFFFSYTTFVKYSMCSSFHFNFLFFFSFFLSFYIWTNQKSNRTWQLPVILDAISRRCEGD